MNVDDVVQFNENHRWCGSLGIITEIKGTRITVGVPCPERGIAYIFCEESEIEYIGKAVLVEMKEEE